MSKLLNASTYVIGRFEHDKMTPSIEAARKTAKILNTTVGYLLEERLRKIFLKTLRCLNDIEKMDNEVKNNILSVIDLD